MNKQVQQVKAEIEKCYGMALERTKKADADYWEGMADGYRGVLCYIDSLQEEPKFKVGQTIRDKEDPNFTFHINKIEDGMYIEDEESWVCIKVADENYELVEEPVSEDLEEAAKINTVSLVLNGLAPDATVKQLREVAVKCFKAGANWQKEQDKQRLAEEHKHVFAKGRESMRDKAVEYIANNMRCDGYTLR